MMRPQRRAFIAGSTSRVVWKAELRLMAITASQRSTGNSSIGATCWMPALLTRMSTPPISISQYLTRAAISSGLLMSAGW